MWQPMPDQQLADINRQHACLIEEAASNRIASLRETGGRRENFTGLRLQLGSLLIVVGRSVCEDDGLIRHPAH